MVADGFGHVAREVAQAVRVGQGESGSTELRNLYEASITPGRPTLSSGGTASTPNIGLRRILQGHRHFSLFQL